MSLSFASIRLFLYNQGSEALPGYGSKICIERKIFKCPSKRSGQSGFKVMDEKLRTKGTGVAAVRRINDALQICVENPCVVLKQSVAKDFLNTTSNADKFSFFMAASKLAAVEGAWHMARDNLSVAEDRQKTSMRDFRSIEAKYEIGKKQYDRLIVIELSVSLQSVLPMV